MSLTITVPTEAELSSYQIIAKIAASNPHWRKLGGDGKPEEIVATILSVMLLARELGFSPMQAVSGGINNIQGKFEISARLMNQAIRARGHKMTIRTLNDDVCEIWGKRRDTGEEMTVTYHIEEARRSGLVRPNGPWFKVPQDMLFARAISRMARRLFPDCIGNCYIEGEIQETVLQKPAEIPVELPKEDFVDVKPEPILHLPEDVSEDRAKEYITKTAEITQRTVSEITQRAVQNMGDFVRSFKKWEEKYYSPPTSPEDLRNATLLGV
jgi:hypothetical protein